MDEVMDLRKINRGGGRVSGEKTFIKEHTKQRGSHKTQNQGQPASSSRSHIELELEEASPVSKWRAMIQKNQSS